MPNISKIKINNILYDIKDANGFSGSWNDLADKPFYEDESGNIIYLDDKFISENIARADSVVEQISNHNTDINAHESIQNAVAANEAAISLLLNGSDPETIDSVNDLINYVTEHGSEVTGIKADIKANSDAIEKVKDAVLYTEQELTDEQKTQARENISRYDWHHGEGLYQTFDIVLEDTTIDWDSLVAIDDASGYFSGTPAIYALTGAAINLASFIHSGQFYMSNYISKELDAIFAGVTIPNNAFRVYVKLPHHEDINYVFLFAKYSESQNAMTFDETLVGTIGSIRYDKTTDTIVLNTLKSTMVQTNFTSVGYPAESKAVGDALALKADQTALDEVSALVGDTAVSEQINAAISESVADWNQNDETAADYIKNRTHYKTANNQTVLDGTFTVETYMGYAAIILPEEFSLEQDVSYTVTVNGISETKYASSLKLASGEEYGMFPGSGVSDYLIDYATDINKYVLYNDAILVVGEECTVNIIDNREHLYIPLNEQYLPTGLGGHGDGRYSWIIGRTLNNEASEENALAHGYNVKALGRNSFARGLETTASGGSSYAEGAGTIASGYGSHAEGSGTIASGAYSHTEGNSTKAASAYQHVEGTYNIEDASTNEHTKGKYAHIVGNGTSDTDRSNAHTLDWNGIGWFQGGLQVGGNAQDDGAKNVMLEGEAYDYFVLNDAVTGVQYKIEIRNGNLTSSLMASLDDFIYTTNEDGTNTITGWNETYLGESSTEMIVPNDGLIII